MAGKNSCYLFCLSQTGIQKRKNWLSLKGCDQGLCSSSVLVMMLLIIKHQNKIYFVALMMIIKVLNAINSIAA